MRPFTMALLVSVVILLCMAAGYTSPALAYGRKREGPSKYKFYLHNTVYNASVDNSNFTSVFSAPPPGNFSNPYGFGILSTFEAPLTAGPSNTSASVGVGNGFFLLDSLSNLVLFHVFTATINDGKYNGTLTIMGQLVEIQAIRIFTVVGGTGDFLLARGAARSHLITLDRTGSSHWTLSFDLDLYY